MDEAATVDETTTMNEAATMDETTTMNEAATLDESTAIMDEAATMEESTTMNEAATTEESTTMNEAATTEESTTMNEAATMEESTTMNEAATTEESTTMNEAATTDETTTMNETTTMDEAAATMDETIMEDETATTADIKPSTLQDGGLDVGQSSSQSKPNESSTSTNSNYVIDETLSDPEVLSVIETVDKLHQERIAVKSKYQYFQRSAGEPSAEKVGLSKKYQVYQTKLHKIGAEISGGIASICEKVSVATLDRLQKRYNFAYFSYRALQCWSGKAAGEDFTLAISASQDSKLVMDKCEPSDDDSDAKCAQLKSCGGVGTDNVEFPSCETEKATSLLCKVFGELNALGGPTLVLHFYKAAALQKEIRHRKSELVINNVPAQHSLDLQHGFIAQLQVKKEKQDYLNEEAVALDKCKINLSDWLGAIRQKVPLALYRRANKLIFTKNYHSDSAFKECPECTVGIDDFDPKPSPWFNYCPRDDVSSQTPRREKLSESTVSSLMADLTALNNSRVYLLLAKAATLQEQVHASEGHLEGSDISIRLSLKDKRACILKSQFFTSKKIKLKKRALKLNKWEAAINDCIPGLRKLVPADLFDRLTQFMMATNYDREILHVLLQWLKSNTAMASCEAQDNKNASDGARSLKSRVAAKKGASLDDEAVLKLIENANDLQKLIVPWRKYLEFDGWYDPLRNVITLKMKHQFIHQQIELKPWNIPRKMRLHRAVEELHAYESELAKECIVRLKQILSPELFNQVMHFDLSHSVEFYNYKVWRLIDQANEMQRSIISLRRQLEVDGVDLFFSNMLTDLEKREMIMTYVNTKKWSPEQQKYFKKAIWKLPNWEGVIANQLLPAIGKKLPPALFIRVQESILALNCNIRKWEDCLHFKSDNYVGSALRPPEKLLSVKPIDPAEGTLFQQCLHAKQKDKLRNSASGDPSLLSSQNQNKTSQNKAKSSQNLDNGHESVSSLNTQKLSKTYTEKPTVNPTWSLSPAQNLDMLITAADFAMAGDSESLSNGIMSIEKLHQQRVTLKRQFQFRNRAHGNVCWIPPSRQEQPQLYSVWQEYQTKIHRIGADISRDMALLCEKLSVATLVRLQTRYKFGSFRNSSFETVVLEAKCGNKDDDCSDCGHGGVKQKHTDSETELVQGSKRSAVDSADSSKQGVASSQTPIPGTSFCGLLGDLINLADPTLVGLVYKAAALRKEMRHLQGELLINDISSVNSVHVQHRFISQQNTWSSLKKDELSKAATALYNHTASTYKLLNTLRRKLDMDRTLYNRVFGSIRIPTYHSAIVLALCPECAISTDDFDPKPSPWSRYWHAEGSSLLPCQREKLSENATRSLQTDLEARNNPNVLKLLDRAATLQRRIHVVEWQLEAEQVDTRLELTEQLASIAERNWNDSKKDIMTQKALEIDKCKANITNDCIAALRKVVPAILFDRLSQFMIATNYDSEAFDVLKRWLRSKCEQEYSAGEGDATCELESSTNLGVKSTLSDHNEVLTLVDKANKLQKLCMPWKAYLEYDGWYQPLRTTFTIKMKHQFIRQLVQQKPWNLPRKDRLERAVQEVHLYESTLANECIIPLRLMLPPELLAREIFSELTHSVELYEKKVVHLIDQANKLHRFVILIWKQLEFEGLRHAFYNLSSNKEKMELIESILIRKRWNFQQKMEFRKKICNLPKLEKRIASQYFAPLEKILPPELFNQVCESIYALNSHIRKWEDYLHLGPDACPEAYVDSFMPNCETEYGTSNRPTDRTEETIYQRCLQSKQNEKLSNGAAEYGIEEGSPNTSDVKREPQHKAPTLQKEVGNVLADQLEKFQVNPTSDVKTTSSESLLNNPSHAIHKLITLDDLAMVDDPSSFANDVMTVEKLYQQRLTLKRQFQFHLRAHGDGSLVLPSRDDQSSRYLEWQEYQTEIHRIGAEISKGMGLLSEKLTVATLVGLQKRYRFIDCRSNPLEAQKSLCENGSSTIVDTSKQNSSPSCSLLDELNDLGDATIMRLVYKAAAFQKEYKHLKSQLQINGIYSPDSVSIQQQSISQQSAWSSVKKAHMRKIATAFDNCARDISNWIIPLRQKVHEDLYQRVCKFIRSAKYHSFSISKLSVCTECAISIDDFNPKPSPWSKFSRVLSSETKKKRAKPKFSTDDSTVHPSETEKKKARPKKRATSSLLASITALKNSEVFNLLNKAAALQQRMHVLECHLESEQISTLLSLAEQLKLIDENRCSVDAKVFYRLKISAIDVSKCEDAITNGCIVPLCKTLLGELFDRLRQFMIATNWDKESFNVLTQWLKSNAVDAISEKSDSTEKAVKLDDPEVLKLVDKANALQKLIVPWKNYLEFEGWYPPLSNLPTVDMKLQFISQESILKPLILPRKSRLEDAALEIYTYESRIANECLVPLYKMLPPESLAPVLDSIDCMNHKDGEWDSCKSIEGNSKSPLQPKCSGSLAQSKTSDDNSVWRKSVALYDPAVVRLIDNAINMQKKIVPVQKQLEFVSSSKLTGTKLKAHFSYRQPYQPSWSPTKRAEFRSAIERLPKWEKRLADECFIPLNKMLPQELFDQVCESVCGLNRNCPKWEDCFTSEMDPVSIPPQKPKSPKSSSEPLDPTEDSLFQLCLQAQQVETTNRTVADERSVEEICSLDPTLAEHFLNQAHKFHIAANLNKPTFEAEKKLLQHDDRKAVGAHNEQKKRKIEVVTSERGPGGPPPHKRQLLPPHKRQLLPPHKRQLLPPHKRQLLPPHKRQLLPPHNRQLLPPHNRQLLPPHNRQFLPPHKRQLLPPHKRQLLPSIVSQQEQEIIDLTLQFLHNRHSDESGAESQKWVEHLADDSYCHSDLPTRDVALPTVESQLKPEPNLIVPLPLPATVSQHEQEIINMALQILSNHNTKKQHSNLQPQISPEHLSGARECVPDLSVSHKRVIDVAYSGLESPPARDYKTDPLVRATISQDEQDIIDTLQLLRNHTTNQQLSSLSQTLFEHTSGNGSNPDLPTRRKRSVEVAYPRREPQPQRYHTANSDHLISMPRRDVGPGLDFQYSETPGPKRMAYGDLHSKPSQTFKNFPNSESRLQTDGLSDAKNLSMWLRREEVPAESSRYERNSYPERGYQHRSKVYGQSNYPVHSDRRSSNTSCTYVPPLSNLLSKRL